MHNLIIVRKFFKPWSCISCSFLVLSVGFVSFSFLYSLDYLDNIYNSNTHNTDVDSNFVKSTMVDFLNVHRIGSELRTFQRWCRQYFSFT